MSLYVYNSLDLEGLDVVKENDLFFSNNTLSLLDDRATAFIKKIDNAELDKTFKYVTKLDMYLPSTTVSNISTGCKTLLNVLYHPDIIFDTIECGSNVLWEIMYFTKGKIVYRPCPVLQKLHECDLIYNGKHFNSLYLFIDKYQETR